MATSGRKKTPQISLHHSDFGNKLIMKESSKIHRIFLKHKFIRVLNKTTKNITLDPSCAPGVTELIQGLVAPGHCHPLEGDGWARCDCFQKACWSCLLKATIGSRDLVSLRFWKIFAGFKSTQLYQSLSTFLLLPCSSPPLDFSDPFPSLQLWAWPALSQAPSVPGSAAHSARAQVLPPHSKQLLASLSRTLLQKPELLLRFLLSLRVFPQQKLPASFYIPIVFLPVTKPLKWNREKHSHSVME